ncbi:MULTISPECIES: carbohydrate ABC transporter permease [Shouchella]|uniref:Carbohydrate ABC transporter permease n=1 Tax=Shouchella hunanensis TaxID=766894 RepID=A0ABY7W6K7_9BACI|nr:MULTISPECIES: carbohydrate ABC transporter permease [Shouchella]WDF03254.1 carbohydrate ABC transporter permease [Shouchella hunanensis]
MNQPSHQPKAPLLMQEQVAPIPPKKKPKRKLFDYKPREILLFFLLFIPLSVMLIPFLYMVSISIKTDGVVLRTLADILPRNPSFDNYATVLANGNFARYLGNSLFVSSSIVIGNVFFCTMVGYTFAKMTFPGKNMIFILVLTSFMIPFQVTMIPVFQLMQNIGWIDTYKALIVPTLVTPFGIFLMRQYISGLPDELIYAAKVDGASEFRIVWQIIFPLAKPIVAVLVIMTFLNSWNDFLSPLILTTSPEMRTIPLGLAEFSFLNNTNWGHLMAASVVSLLPVFIIFVFFQKQIISGLVSGAIKT